MTLAEIQSKFRDEYDALSEEDKEALVKEFKDEKEGSKKIKRATARGRLQDVLNTVRNIKQLVSSCSNTVAQWVSMSNTQVL